MRQLPFVILFCCVAALACGPREPWPSWPPDRRPWEPDSKTKDKWGFQGKVDVGANDVVERPEILNHEPHPRYTEEARRKKINGVNVCELRIDAEGRVTEVVVTQPLDPELDQVAVDVMRQWTFEPAKLNGVPLPSFTVITTHFQIQ